MKLVPLHALGVVLEQLKVSDNEYRKIRNRYDDISWREPNLWMFIPCDQNEIPLASPSEADKEKCLFKGFKLAKCKENKIVIEFDYEQFTWVKTIHGITFRSDMPHCKGFNYFFEMGFVELTHAGLKYFHFPERFYNT